MTAYRRFGSWIPERSRFAGAAVLIIMYSWVQLSLAYPYMYHYNLRANSASNLGRSIGGQGPSCTFDVYPNLSCRALLRVAWLIIPAPAQKCGGRSPSSLGLGRISLQCSQRLSILFSCWCWGGNSGSAGVLLCSWGCLCDWAKSMRALRKSSVE